MNRMSSLRVSLLAATALTAALSPIPASADVTIVGGTTVDLGGGTVFHNNLFLDDGTLTNGTFDATIVFDLRRGFIDANLTGAGDLTKNSGNTVTLSGVNTYAGSTTINDGTLIVSGGSALPDATALIINGFGLLQVEDSETIGHLSGSGTLQLDGTSVLSAGGDNQDSLFTGFITGTGGLTKDGFGTLELTNSSDYSGATTINGGTLRLSGFGQPGALGVADVTVNDGATLDITDTSQLLNSLTLNDNATVTNAFFGAGVINFSTLNVVTGSGTTATLFPPISGSGTITKDGAGTFVVAGFPNSGYSGTVDLNAGTLQLIWGSALGSANLNINGPSTLSLNNGAGNGQNFFNTITLAGDGAVIDVGENVSVQWGVIGESGGSHGFTKTGGGALALGGNNTFTGLTSVQEGTLFLGWNNSGAGSLAGPIDLAAGTLLDIWRSGSLTLGGNISGDGTIIMDGLSTGTATLSGNNTYTGTTIVDGGTLVASGGNAFSDVGALFVNSGGTAQIDDDENIGSLFGDGAITLNANLKLDAGTYSAFDGVMSGTGGVHVGNLSQLNLSAVQTYTGLTTISDSQLVLNGAANLAGNVSILGADATLTFADTGPSLRTYGGNISGNGNLRLNIGPAVGANGGNIGVVQFSGANNLTGLTTIEKGRLQIIDGGSISGDVFVAGTNDTAWLDFNQSGTLTYAGSISGENVSYGGGGTTILTGVNTHNYNGIGQGTLQISGAGTLGNSNTQVWLSGFGAGAFLDLGDTTQDISVLRTFNGYTNSVFNGTLNVSNQMSLETGTISANLTGTAVLDKFSGGTVTLSGNNTYTGDTVLFDGTLVAQGGNAISDTSNVSFLGSAATLQLDANETVGGLDGSGGGTLALGSNTLTFGGNGLNTATNLAITGDASSSLIKAGSGTTDFSNGLGHLGTTFVNAGEINVNGAVAGSVVVNAGGRYSGISTIAGDLTVLGTLATGNSPGTTTVLGNYTGGGTLDVEVQFDNAGSPVNGVTHDFLDISGNVLGSPTAINLLTYAPSGSPAATTGNGIQIIRVGGNTSAADFTMSSYLLGSYFYDLAYLHDYSGTSDGFFLQSTLATPGCVVTTGNDACFIDSSTNQATPVDALAGNDTLQLTGATNFNFDVSTIGTVYTNFETYQKAGTSTVTLTGTAGFTAVGFDIQNGTLEAGTGQLGALGANNIFSPGILHVTSDLTTGSIAGNGGVILDGTLTTGGNDLSTTFSGVISGSGGLTKEGTGAFTLSGTNTFTGATTINNGSLILSGGNALSDLSDVTINASGLLQVDTAETVRSLAGSGNALLNDTLTVSGGSLTFYSGVMSGAGGLTVANNSNLVLTGDNTYTGLTTVDASQLRIGNFGPTGSVAGDILLQNSATLYFLRSGDYSWDHSVSGSGVVIIDGGSSAETATWTAANSGNAIAVSNKTLQVSGAGTIGAFEIQANSDGIIDLGGTTQNVGRVVAQFGGEVRNGTINSSFDFFLNDTAAVSANIIGAPIGVTKNFAGTAVLSGANSFSGAVNVNGGLLIANNAAGHALGGTATLNIASPGAVQVNFGETVGKILGNGSLILNAALTVNDSSSYEFDGVISSTGKLVKDGTGMLALGGVNTFSGGIDILHGGVRLLNNSSAGTGPITTFGSVISYANAVNNAAPIIVNSNTTQLEVLAADAATQSGSISESGGPRPIEKIGTGTLTLTGNNTYTGLTTITAGKLVVQGGNAIANSAGVTTGSAGTFALNSSETIGSFAGAGTLQIGASTLLTTGGNNASTTFSGTSSGAGGLTKTGSGVFTLTGANAFTGPLTVSAGNLSVVSGGSLSGMTSFNVLGGAQTFLGGTPQGVNGSGMTGTGIGSISVSSGGTAYLDDNTSLSVGSVNLASGSNLNVFLTTNTAQYGKITASGAATVSGANVGVYLDPITFSGTLATTFTYNNIVTGSSVSGTFGSVNLLQAPSPLFSVTGIYSGTSAGVQVTRNAFSNIGGDGSNQGNVGGGLEQIFTDGTTDPDLINLFNVIGSAPAGSIPAIYAAIAGAANAENLGAGLRTDDPWKQSVAERVNAARTTGCTVSGDSWCLRRYAQASTNGGEVMSDVQGDPTAFDWLETGIRDEGSTSFWARGIGAWGETRGDLNGPGSSQWTGGLIGGVDRVVNSLLLAGVALQYVETNVNYDASPNKSQIQSGQVGAYVSYGGAEAYVNGNVSVIGSQANANRFMNIGLLNYNVESKARSLALTASVEGGTIMEFDGYRFEPSLALNYAGAFPQNFEEHGGGGLSLIVNPDDSASLRSILSARLSRVFDLGDRKIVPQIRFDWRHEMLDSRQEFTAAFAGAPSVSFDVKGATYARDVFATGASVTMPITGQITGYVDAQGAFSDDTTSVMVSLGGRATW